MFFTIIMSSLTAIAVHHGSYGYAAFVFSLMVGGYLNALEKGSQRNAVQNLKDQ